MTNTASTDAIRSEFIEKIGLITQAEGLPRIAGRVFGMLVFDGELVSFGDLAQRLDVSRASISTSIRLLEERGLVKRVAKSGQRQDFFQLAQNPYGNMLEGIQKRTCAARNEIVDTINSLPQGADAIERLNSYAQFYTSIDAAVGRAIGEIHSQNTRSVGLQGATKEEI